jgi:hypothetical protein
MKKILFTLLTSLLTVALLDAQIPNPSFESWSGGDPVSWFTGNTGQFQFVTESGTAHDGSKAAQCNVVTFVGQSFSSPLALGNLGQGVHTSSAPEAIHGWYIFNSVSNDIGLGSCGMMADGQTTGAGAYQFGPSSVYKEFVIDMYYYTSVPNGDSILMYFLMSNPQSELPHDGSYLIIDDLSFGPLSSVNEINNSVTSIESITPNPAELSSEIIYQIQTPGTTTIQTYDATGTQVQNLLNENQAPGRYKVIANVSNLANGVYFVRLMTDSYVQVRAMQVSH